VIDDVRLLGDVQYEDVEPTENSLNSKDDAAQSKRKIIAKKYFLDLTALITFHV